MSETVEDLLAKPAEFDARAFIRGAAMAKGEVTVFTDGDSARRLVYLEAELAKAEAKAESLSAGSNGGITHSEGYDEAEAEVEALKAQEAELVEASLASKMTFHLRGITRKQVQLIDQKWRKAIKFAVRSHFPEGDEGDEAFNLAEFERNRERNEGINYELVAKSIYKVVDSEGNEDTNVWSVEDVEALAGNLYDSEWYKVLGLMKELTFSEHIFRAAVEADSDFLSKR
jgi:hypothetical protein